MADGRIEIVREAIRRFPQYPDRTIARHILNSHGPLFDGSLEKIRSSVRYCRGKNGAKGRENIGSRIITKGDVTMPKTWRRVRNPYKLAPGRWLVLADVHVPFHEPKPIEAAIKYGQDQKVTGILFNGDLQDCAAVSFWPSEQRRDFDREIEALLDFLDFIEHEFPGLPKVYKPGNHEYRLPRYYAARAPELLGLASDAFDSVLGLEDRGIEFLQYKQIVMAGKLPIVHGDEFRISRTVNPARGLFLRAKTWALCSHCHTTSEHTAKDLKGTLLTTWSTGALCDLSPDYNPFGNDWCWGFAIVDVEKNGGFIVENHRILPSGKVA